MTAATLKRLELAAMRWYDFYISVGATKESFGPQARRLFLALAAHDRAQRKGAKRKRK